MCGGPYQRAHHGRSFGGHQAAAAALPKHGLPRTCHRHLATSRLPGACPGVAGCCTLLPPHLAPCCRRHFCVQVDQLWEQCDPSKENLCLYGYSDGTWEVTLPCEEVPPELPEPTLGINFARDGAPCWLALLAGGACSPSTTLACARACGCGLVRSSAAASCLPAGGRRLRRACSPLLRLRPARQQA